MISDDREAERTLRLPTAEGILADPAASAWLRWALEQALLRDPVDAANDAAMLAEVLAERAGDMLDADEARVRPGW